MKYVEKVGDQNMNRFYKPVKPIEITGVKMVLIWTVDHITGMDGFRWYNVANEDHSDDDVLPWDGDSSIDDCSL